MKKQRRICFYVAIGLLVLFIVWTVLLGLVDVQTVGPGESRVGFATMNLYFHRLTGVHMILYHITDWLGLVPVAFSLGFAVTGLIQWIHRKSIRKVDFSILVLGVFYIATLITYIIFENVVINYRPVLINSCLEVSYPSSTTLLVMCVMPTAIMQLKDRIQNIMVRKSVVWLMVAFVVFMVAGRLMSGVHWVTDIVGGALISAALVLLYRAACTFRPN